MDLGHEKQLREAVTLSAELVSILKEKLDKLPRGSLSIGGVEVPTNNCSMEHMKCVIELVQAALKQAQQNSALPNERGKSAQHLVHPQYAPTRGAHKEVAAVPAHLERIGNFRGSSKVGKSKRQLIKSKYTVRVSGGVAVPDGFVWRKYGQKVIQNGTYSRSYYRCRNKLSQGCPAQKQVQKAENDVTAAGFDVTYINEHTCGHSQPQNNGMLHDHENDHNYTNFSPNDTGILLNPEDNNHSRMPCSDSNGSISFPAPLYVDNSHEQSVYNIASNSCPGYYPTFYDKTAIINSSSVLTSPSTDYAEHMQASSFFNKSAGSSGSASPHIVHQPLNNDTFVYDIFTYDHL